MLAPETPMEWNKGVAPVAAPFTDGCWYDPADGVYRLYYHAGWFDGTALAVSADGRHFTRKMLDNQVGTNRIFVPQARLAAGRFLRVARSGDRASGGTL